MGGEEVILKGQKGQIAFLTIVFMGPMTKINKLEYQFPKSVFL